MSLDTLTLNGTSLADTTVFGLEAIDFTPPAKKPEWAQSVDSDGSALVRTPLFENRTITASIRIVPQATMDLALEKLGILVDLLQEAEKNPDGIPLEWSPATATKKITFYVLTGAVTGIPMVNDGQGAGWYAKSPLVTVAFTCKPFGYGAEVEAAAAKSIETGLSVVVLTVPTVAGDVPAEGRLVITDTAAVGRRFVEWGLENRYYNASAALVLDSEDMTPVGGTQNATLAGAYKRAGATKATIKTLLLPEPTICCNTGNLKHIGTFRVKARVQASVGTLDPEAVEVRLSYQDGEGPLRANPWVKPPAANVFVELDLGLVTLTPAITGTQKWLAQIEAYSENTPLQDTLHVDYLTFIPAAEGYGKALGAQPTGGLIIDAYDNFTTGTLSGNLNTRTPAIGAAWATSGAPTDFTVATAKATRATTSDGGPRYAVLGPSLINMQTTISITPTLGTYSAAIVRWTNASNYAAFVFHYINAKELLLTLRVVTGGTLSELTSTSVGNVPTVLAVGVTADGTIRGVALEGEVILGRLNATNNALATGGILAEGKGGYYDYNPTATAATRALLSLAVYQTNAPPYCIQPSNSMEVRSDSTLTEDATGTYVGPPPEYRGSRFFVPQDGSANRTSRILVKADRNDLEESDQQTIADAFTAQVYVTSRYHVIPR